MKSGQLLTTLFVVCCLPSFYVYLQQVTVVLGNRTFRTGLGKEDGGASGVLEAARKRTRTAFGAKGARRSGVVVLKKRRGRKGALPPKNRRQTFRGKMMTAIKWRQRQTFFGGKVEGTRRKEEARAAAVSTERAKNDSGARFLSHI